jgi:integrase
MLDKQGNPLTYSDARDEFLSVLNRDPKTEQVYRRAIDLFLEFEPTPLHELGIRDQNVLPRFIRWLRKREINRAGVTRRDYAESTIRVYLQGVRKWFGWMNANRYLPSTIDYAGIVYNTNEAMHENSLRGQTEAPEPPKGMRELLTYYDTVQPPEKIIDNPARLRRWQLETLRNRALLRVLAETGGRISEVLKLRVDDFPPRAFRSDPWRVEVETKNRFKHKLWFSESLPYIRAYMKERGAIDGPLFVKHGRKNGGQIMTRFSAWHVVNSASAALGLERIHPHDFRHWCATELVNKDVPLDVIQEHLGHKSVNTTRQYYAHTKTARVDEHLRRAKLLS